MVPSPMRHPFLPTQALPGNETGGRCVIFSSPKSGKDGIMRDTIRAKGQAILSQIGQPNTRDAIRAKGQAILTQIAEPRAQVTTQSAQARVQKQQQRQQQQQQQQFAHMGAMSLEQDFAGDCVQANFWGEELDQTLWNPWALNDASEAFVSPSQADCLPNLLSQQSPCKAWSKAELARLDDAECDQETTTSEVTNKSDRAALVDATAKHMPVKILLPQTLKGFAPMKGADPEVPLRKQLLCADLATSITTADPLAPARKSVSSFLLKSSSLLDLRI
jgi:hypothetical protein